MIIAKPLKDREPNEIRTILEQLDLETKCVESWMRLHKYACDQHPPLGISALAHRTRISSSTLSEGFSGIYRGDMHAVAERIDQFFWRLEQIDLYGGLRQFVITDLSRSLCSVFDKARITRRVHFIQSPEQLGKTRTAIEYTSLNNTGRTIYVKLAGGSKSGCGDFIWALAQALEIPYSLKMREKRIRIKEVLQTCDLIIIDEAHLSFTWTLNAQAEFWDYIRTDVHDDGKRGLVFISTNSDMMKGLQNFRKRADYNVGQLIGRMRNQVMVIDPAEDILESDVRLLVTRYYKPSAPTLHKLHDLCTREGLGHFGLLDDIMNESWTRAKAKKKELCDDVVMATMQEILEELKERKSLYEK